MANFQGKMVSCAMLAHLALVVMPTVQTAAERPMTQYNHSFVATSEHDFLLSGGASVTRNPLNSLRSGSPNQHSSATFVLPLSPGVTLTSISFNYRYTIGWGAPAPGKGTNFSLSAGTSRILYSSPAYNDYPYSKAHPNYSLPVNFHADVSEPIPASGTTRLELWFDNNDRNIQLLLPLEINVTCSGGPCVAPPPTPPPAPWLGAVQV